MVGVWEESLYWSWQWRWTHNLSKDFVRSIDQTVRGSQVSRLCEGYSREILYWGRRTGGKLDHKSASETCRTRTMNKLFQSGHTTRLTAFLVHTRENIACATCARSDAVFTLPHLRRSAHINYVPSVEDGCVSALLCSSLRVWDGFVRSFD